MIKPGPKVDAYIRRAGKWREELKALRRILLDTALTEDLKWRAPCYTYQGHNVVILGGLKEYCAFSFFKGALLRDAKGILETPGENTQSGRLIRFTSVQEIDEMETVLKAYVREAIEVERAGLKVDFRRLALTIPAEFQDKLDRMPALRTAFEKLTPGRQRAYTLYISAAKLSKTRASRVEKCVPKILAGRGVDEEYVMKKPLRSRKRPRT